MEKITDVSIENKKAFINLVCRLSPENLACDGEISEPEIDLRYAQCMREWRALEKQVGRKVSEEEAEKWAYQPVRLVCNNGLTTEKENSKTKTAKGK